MLAVLPLAVSKARLTALRPARLRMRRPICWPVGNSLSLRRVFARRLESNCCRTPQRPVTIDGSEKHHRPPLHLPCGAKLRKMNTYTALARNSPKMNTCAKTKGGTPSPVLRTILSSTANHRRISTYAIAAANSCRMCTCEPLGPQPSLESTLAKKPWWGPPPDGFFRP